MVNIRTREWARNKPCRIGSEPLSSVKSLKESVGMEYTSFDKFEKRDPFDGITGDEGNGVVAMKSVSSFLTGATAFVSYQTPSAPL